LQVEWQNDTLSKTLLHKAPNKKCKTNHENYKKLKKLVSFIVLASYYFNHLPFAATSSIQYYDRESGDLKRKSGAEKWLVLLIITVS
jgi:hypothetical protein